MPLRRRRAAGARRLRRAVQSAARCRAVCRGYAIGASSPLSGTGPLRKARLISFVAVAALATTATACNAGSSATPSTCSRDGLVATVGKSVTTLLACSDTTLVPEATITITADETVVLSGPELVKARVQLASGPLVVAIRGPEIVPIASGVAIVNVVGLHCGEGQTSQNTGCPLMQVRVQ